MRKLLVIAVLIACCVPSVHAQDSTQSGIRQEIYKAKVVSLSAARTDEWNGVERVTREAEILLRDGPDSGTTITLNYSVVNGSDNLHLKEGDTVLVERLEKPNGEMEYFFREQYRLHSLFFLLALFIVLSVVLAGWTGIASFGGLMVSIAILIFFVVPQIAAGRNPLLISLIGSFMIACSSLYLAHGFHRRTTIALMSTMLTLVLTTFLALFAVSMTSLFGMGSEEAVFLQFGLATLNLRGLLLGSIVIGALGVLDDITTAQTAAIAEISRANPRLGFRELYTAGSAVGKEHIASLINTLALAYFGTSMPLMLLFGINRDLPVWAIVNAEFIAEEIVRTLVGSSALLLAVPISTWFAARAFAHGAHSGEIKGHHGHHH